MSYVANFITFLAVEEFQRSVKFWPSYSKLNLAHFWDMLYYMVSLLMTFSQLLTAKDLYKVTVC